MKSVNEYRKSDWAACVLILGLASSALGCRKHSSDTTEPAASASATANAAPSAKNKVRLVPHPGGTTASLEGYTPELFRIPVGPRLGIIPGRGMGPVRFGATVETVERLLEVKCSIKTETECRILSHAVDFKFKDGVVDEMRIHGEERQFSDKPGETYGLFNGRFLDGAALGMYPKFVQETLGEPKRVEKVEDPTKERFPTVERHFYDNMVLEYDRLKNGNVVLAGVILTRPAPGTEPPEPALPVPGAKQTKPGAPALKNSSPASPKSPAPKSSTP